MTILRSSHVQELQQRLGSAQAELFRLRAELADARGERDILADQLRGEPEKAMWWLQSKVWRQRRALDRLERRNGTLRFALRLMNRLRDPVTAEEWKTAREAERSRDRLEEEPPARLSLLGSRVLTVRAAAPGITAGSS